MRFITVIAIFIFLSSCRQVKNTELPIAQVFESTLYRNEISEFIPQGTSQEDSLLMAQSYIRNWVTQKLLLHKAIENLSGEEAGIRKQVKISELPC
ncbi:MAG: hypothetical protein V8S95_02500 [Odoribacter sp.]